MLLKVPKQRLSLTKEGKLYLAVTLGVGIAAVNTGNNLLYLLLGWLLSMIIASGILSNIAIKSLRIERKLPEHIFANTPFTVTIKCTNSKRFFSSYAIEFFDHAKPTWGQPNCLFVKIRPGETTQQTYQSWFANRGKHSLTSCWLTTRFPFGLFTKRSLVDLKQACVVYPMPEPTHVSEPTGRLQGHNTTPTKGTSGDFYGLRPYRIGDEMRSVDWKSTAKHSELIVKELEKETRRQVTLVVNNPKMPKGPLGIEVDLERAVVLAASLAKRFIANDFSVSLASRGTSLPSGTGPGHLFSIYNALAHLQSEVDEVGIKHLAVNDVFTILCKGTSASPTITTSADKVVFDL